MYRARESYRPGAKFATWLFRITTNVALNWRRDTRRESSQLRLDEVDRASAASSKWWITRPAPISGCSRSQRG